MSTVVLAEVWRDPPSAAIARLLKGCRVEPVDAVVAKCAGAAVGATGASSTDAVIAATARAGAPLLTADSGDMQRLAGHFAGLRLILL